MTTLTPSSTDSYQVVALGFWLPCGRGNFYRNSEDGELFKPGKKELADKYKEKIRKDEVLQSSSINRFIKVLGEIDGGTIIPIIPNSRRKKVDSDPEGIVFYLEAIGINVEKIIFLSNEKGFNILIGFIYHYEENKAKVDKILLDFVTTKICGSRNITISNIKENFKKSDKQERIPEGYEYDGILPFFQLNLITEGLFNPDFDPRKFFNSSPDKVKIQKVDDRYSLKKFSRKIISSPIIINENSSDHLEMRKFFENKDKKSGEELEDDIINVYDHIFKESEVTTEILRQFLKNISADCLLDLKWDIESCRRNLLNVMLNSIHKQDRLNQLESRDRDAKDSYMRGSNEAQLRGYAMFISAKLPLILNVNRHINTVYNSYLKSASKEQIRPLFDDWHGLVEAIDENISRLDRAIEQSRMDTLLLEQQQIRAEQETMAEIERVRERNGNNGSGGDGGSSAIGLNNNHIAMMALLLAIILFPKITVKNGSGDLVTEEIYIILFKYLFEKGKFIYPIEEYLTDFLFLFIPCLIFSFIIALTFSRIFYPDFTKSCINYLYKWCENKLYQLIYFFVKGRNFYEWFTGTFNLFRHLITHRKLPAVLNISKTSIDVKLKATKSLFKEQINNSRKSKIKHVYGILLFLSAIEVTLCLEHFWRINKSPNKSFVLIQITTLLTIFLVIFWSGKLLEAYERHKKDDEIEGQKKAKFYYEMDVRIQLPITKDYVNKLTSGKPIYISDTLNEKIEIKRDSYKAEYFSGAEIHHKIYFEAPIRLSTNLKYKLEELPKAYLTFEIIEQQRASSDLKEGHLYLFNEFRFVLLTFEELSNDEISEVEEIVKKQFINGRFPADGRKLEFISDESIFKLVLTAPVK
jgi:hypothetical protein